MKSLALSILTFLLLLTTGNSYSGSYRPQPEDFSTRVMAVYAGHYLNINSPMPSLRVFDDFPGNDNMRFLYKEVCIGFLVGLIEYTLRYAAENEKTPLNIVWARNIARTVASGFFAKIAISRKMNPTLSLALFTSMDYIVTTYWNGFFSKQSIKENIGFGILNTVFAASLTQVSAVNHYLMVHYPQAVSLSNNMAIAYFVGIIGMIAIVFPYHLWSPS